MQYKIPQNIGVEDRIVGPFTLKQLIIVAVGGGISYVLFTITSKIYELNVLEYVIIAFPALIALAAALIKINNIPFTKFVLLTLEYAIKPKKRLWDHRGIAPLVAPDLTETKVKTEAVATDEKTKESVNLDDLTKVLDSGGFDHVEDVKHKDIDTAEDEDLVTEAFFGHKAKESPTENMYWRTKESQKKRLDMLAKMPATKTKKKEEKPAVGIPLSGASEDKKKEEKPASQLESQPEKKKRRRRRKPKAALPARQETQINNTERQKPVKLIPKPKPQPPRDLSPRAVQTGAGRPGQ
ncbi:PrgI family protein, partial [Patescibacteria group bacterium]|nr:PrgI family protein [Patescibacteria group bacterium]